MQPIIEVNGLSKKYRLGESQPYYTLRDSLAGLFKNPLAAAREQLEKDEFWALKDVNFTVNQGEVVGIIGRNGAGKSTLLKILSQITPPTEGEVILRGRVGSLLEVGTGFSPELTGRENIYLNGAVLGMKRSEVKRKFDEIVAFSEVEKFLDTPLKHFSSGMYMRLAFAVAAHLEPEILIVDEVLAVGDAEFQKKCLGKMGEVAGEGRTVLFVSHNMGAVAQLCIKACVIKDGALSYFGTTKKAIDIYSSGDSVLQNKIFKINTECTKKIFLKSVEIDSDNWSVSFRAPIKLKFLIDVLEPINSIQFGIGINNSSHERLMTVHSKQMSLSIGQHLIEVEIENNLIPSIYTLSFGALTIFNLPELVSIEVLNDNNIDYFNEYNYGYFAARSEFKTFGEG